MLQISNVGPVSHMRVTGLTLIRLFSVALLSLTFTACATGLLDTGNSNSQASGWQLLAPANAGSVEIWQEIPGGSVSLFCSNDGCLTLLEPDYACVVGDVFPILINLPVEPDIAVGECLPFNDVSDTSENNGMIFLDGVDILYEAMLMDHVVAIGIPNTTGGIDVFNMPMSGVQELLEPLLPDLFETLNKPVAPTPAPIPSAESFDTNFRL